MGSSAAHNPWQRRINVSLGMLCLIVFGYAFVRYFLLMQVSVVDEGMRPTLHRGDRVLVNRAVDNYEIGDLVVFNYGEDFFVRRVVGIDGDRVGVSGGVVESNGFVSELQDRGIESYTGFESASGEEEKEGPVEEFKAVERTCGRKLESIGFSSYQICLGTGPDERDIDVEARPLYEGQFYVMCDNRFDCRADSRDMGAVLKGAIRGKVTHLMERDSPGVSPSLFESTFGLWEAL